MPTAARRALPPSPTPWNFHFVTLSTLKFIAIGANKGKRFPASKPARAHARQNSREGWLLAEEKIAFGDTAGKRCASVSKGHRVRHPGDVTEA